MLISRLTLHSNDGLNQEQKVQNLMFFLYSNFFSKTSLLILKKIQRNNY
jgi:hypothetical protein